MAKLKILTGENNPILRKVSVPISIEEFDEKLKKFAKDLEKIMKTGKGLGIAAPQVGQNIRLIFVTLNYGKEGENVIAMVNPKIVSHGNSVMAGEEGCLSLPGIYGIVSRYEEIEVEFCNLEGGEGSLNLSRLDAREVQHEIDHLDGILFVDRMKELENRKGLAF